MRNSTLLCWRDLLWIALQARHLNENLENNLQLESFSVSSVCSVDYYHRNLDGIYTDFIELLRKKSLEEIFNKIWPEARNYSSSITYKH